MRTTRSGKRFEVFEFNEEDERIEKVSRKFLGQFRNPNKSDDPALTKYSFLQCIAQGTETQHKAFSNEPLDVDACDGAVTERISSLDAIAPLGSSNYERTTYSCPNYHNSRYSFSGVTSHAARAVNFEVTSTGSKQLDSTLPPFLSDNEPVGINDDDNSIELRSSTSASDPAEKKGPSEEQVPDHGFGGCDSFSLDESFKEVIYPKGDPDAVSIRKGDVELLKPGTFINDTIVDFYLKYLKNKIKPEEKHRFHFFNSFFFRKLADLDKDSSRACRGRADFQRIHKWTRKVNLFEKDFVFIPVNFSLHWSLIVICHPGELANSKDEDTEKSPKVPCILHMDSIKGSHRGLKNLIQSYLWEEWKGRQSEPVENVSSKFLNLRFVPLELPQQKNPFDCGLFLLHYVERFLEQAPVNFSPFKITKFSNFLNKNWFPPEEASLKRTHIEKLIYEIVEDSSQKGPPAICNYNYPSELPKINESDAGIEFLREIWHSTDTFHGNYSSSTADQELEITQLVASPPSGVQCFIESELVFRELEPGSIAGLLTDENYQTFKQIASLKRFKNLLSPIEEGEETGEQTAYSPADEEDGQQVAEKNEPSSPSYPAKDFRASKTSLFSGTVHLEENYDIDSSGTDVQEDEPVSSEVGVNEDHPPEEILGSNPEEESESSSESSDRFAACVVEDSLEANETDDDNENEDSPSCEVISFSQFNQEIDSAETAELETNNMSVVSESEQQAAKRPRFMPPEGRR